MRVFEALHVGLEAGDDAVVAGDFRRPVAGCSVVAQGADVGQLGLQRWEELVGGNEVVAGFADVGVWAGFGGKFTGAEAMRNTGFEHLGVEPFDPVGDQWFADRGDR